MWMQPCIVLSSFKSDIFVPAAFVHRAAATTDARGGLRSQLIQIQQRGGSCATLFPLN